MKPIIHEEFYTKYPIAYENPLSTYSFFNPPLTDKLRKLVKYDTWGVFIDPKELLCNALLALKIAEINHVYNKKRGKIK